MFILRTGLPGASKTLNLISETCESKFVTSDTNIYYNNIKLLFLDFSVCESFQGFFYGVYLPSLSKKELKKIQKIVRKIHDDDRLAELSDFPFLDVDYQTYTASNSPLDLFLKWAKRAYPTKRIQPLDDYIALRSAEKIKLSELSQFNLDWRYFDEPRKWYELPRGSIVIIDECQRFFAPRPVGSPRPKHISEIETHRHYGIILSFVTQDAKLLDSDARRLVTKHIHYENKFGSNRVLRFDSNKAFDVNDYHAKQSCIKKIIKRNSQLYGCYFSADVHYNDFRLPPKFILFFVLIFVALISFYFLFIFITNLVSNDDELNPIDDKPVTIFETSSNSGIVVVPHLHSTIVHPYSYCNEFNLSYVQYFSFRGMSRIQPHFECVLYSDDDDSTYKTMYIQPHVLVKLGYRYDITRTLIELKFAENSIIYENYLQKR